MGITTEDIVQLYVKENGKKEDNGIFQSQN